MKKNILYLLFLLVIGAITLAGTLSYTTAQVETAVGMTDTGNYTSVATITMTNGWTIICTNGIEFAAP